LISKSFRRVTFATAAAVGVSVVAFATLPVSGQTQGRGAAPAAPQGRGAQPAPGRGAAAQPAYRPTRLPDGKPDFNGIWQALNEANWNLESHMAQAALQMRPGPMGPLPAKEVLYLGAVGSVPGGPGVVVGDTIPYKPEALKQREKNRAEWSKLDPEVKCYLPGVPRATYMPYPFQIFQSASAIFIAYEYAGAVRNIYLKDPGPPPVDSWMGQSTARWDGDTLVIEAHGFNDQSWFDRAGNFHSELLRVTERYTRVQPDVINYEATINDPQTFTKPWTIRMPLYRRLDGRQIMDFKCVEFVEELMYGEWRKNPLPR
jgi:hypothetical protein